MKVCVHIRQFGHTVRQFLGRGVQKEFSPFDPPGSPGAGAANGHISMQGAALQVGDEDDPNPGTRVGPVVCKASEPYRLHATDQ